MTAYLLLKYLHVVLAIVAVGFNASYAVWVARAQRDPAHQAFALRGVKFLDDRLANPAYVLLLLSGIALALVGRLDFKTFWIAAAIALWLVVVIIGLAVYTPTLRRQIEMLERDGAAGPEFARIAGRSQTVGIVLAVLVLAIVFLMVVKPTL